MIEASSKHNGRPSWAVLAAALVFYAVVVSLGAAAGRDHINPDGIAYIRSAVLLAEGRWLDSVTGYWSPLLPWSIAPFIYFGCDGLHASRFVLASWGGVLVVAAWAFLYRCTAIASPWAAVVIVLIATAAAQWSTASITPDVLLGAVLLWYFFFTAGPEVLSSRRTQILAGAVGGMAYLAKSYAFPFFIAHYPLTLLLHFVLGRPQTRAWAVLQAWATGLIAFAIFAGPWVGVLSSKYGRFTFSTVAASAHNLVGPPGLPSRNEALYRAQRVPAGRITVWETPEILAVEAWSPFASWNLLKHQLTVIKRNCDGVFSTIAGFDRLAILPGLLFLMLSIRLAATWRGNGGTSGRYPATWLLMTIITFAGGFLPIYFEPRYLEPVLWPLCCMAAFDVLADAGRLLQHHMRASRVLLVMSVLCASSFAAHLTTIANTALNTLTATISRKEHPIRSPYRDCGNKLVLLKRDGPVAACNDGWATGLYVSYHASLPFIGVVHGQSPAAVEASLEQSDARIFVANSAWNLFKEFSTHTKWRNIFTVDGAAEGTISLFVAPGTD